jgi:hypothetical protein
MQIGTMEIMGTINIENIKTGITQMKKSFSDIKMEDISPSVNLDNLKTSFTEINTQSISLADNMNRIGTSASFENINTGLDLTKYSLGGVQTQTKSLAESMKKLGGSVYTEGVTRGLTQMKNSLSSAKVQAKSLFGDMSRLGKTVAGMGKTMAVAGVGFLASLIALASVGPQTSVAMERMKFEMFRLGMVADSVVGPAMNKLADDFGTFTDIISSGEPWYAIIGNLISTGLHLDEVKLAVDAQIKAWKEGQDLGPIKWIIEVKKKVEEGLEGILPSISPEMAENMMWGDQKTRIPRPEEITPIPTTGRGRTAEEAGLIFRESSKSEETTTKLEFPSEINVEQLIINTSNVERASN